MYVWVGSPIVEKIDGQILVQFPVEFYLKLRNENMIQGMWLDGEKVGQILKLDDQAEGLIDKAKLDGIEIMGDEEAEKAIRDL